MSLFTLDNKMVTRTKKIFVGGLSAPTTLEDVKSYFEQFGPDGLLGIGRSDQHFLRTAVVNNHGFEWFWRCLKHCFEGNCIRGNNQGSGVFKGVEEDELHSLRPFFQVPSVLSNN
ncbi:hypothetical protein Zmor_026043 [Zophobas morio]|uniref:RRM domain-containing protein n=1 Tax=Zophobas morio TaxID=2755281 RepID=A0AA38HTD2_9CUCU|nr:hypothetical protein Zmor_026043 [Zophobas morio]